MPAEKALLDTNVLVYALYTDAEQHSQCRKLLEGSSHSGAALCVTSQVLAEFFSIVTNPKRVSTPRTPEDAAAAVEAILSLSAVAVMPTPPDTPARWLQLVRRHPVRVAAIFDLQLVATMQANDIRRIYTFNKEDFAPFNDLEFVIP